MDGKLYGTVKYGGRSCYAKRAECGAVFSISTSGAENVIYAFKGPPDAANPQAALTNINGSWYGVTAWGGTHGRGAIFKISSSGKEEVLYSFKGGRDGEGPLGQLTSLNGVLYGTTDTGGSHRNGTVYSCTLSGRHRVLHRFKYSDGSAPYAGLTVVGDMLYGTTNVGGAENAGTVFSITKAGEESVIHSFHGRTDGEGVQTPLILVDGALYGTTVGGGGPGREGHGTVFKMTLSGRLTVLHRFGKRGALDGNSPQSLVSVNGTLYGAAYKGGSDGFGVIFSLTQSKEFRILYSFSRPPDGGYPTGGLKEINGWLYGTTSEGGTGSCSYFGPAFGCGTVFALKL
ncbi:MAG TPA: choice-of-anchor tandem repeat GloVer-containing protein [Candidatus Baltobacteraceae bacterium]|jgi:uncharacterized repeat protein (TIGR03803 family)|nr:choice-of-anchor tandem repeat GloVer-containing protein [Candidatus Baltobacteraceae bacterium]